MLYLQGGPSHIDLWDPKENVPDNVQSVFSNISTKLPGVQFTELLPNLAVAVGHHPPGLWINREYLHPAYVGAGTAGGGTAWRTSSSRRCCSWSGSSCFTRSSTPSSSPPPQHPLSIRMHASNIVTLNRTNISLQ
jgi:hypothetical protein